MDRLFESQRAYQPRGWQASVLAEQQGRRRRWLEKSAWMTSNDAVTTFVGVLGLALLVFACVMLMVWALSLRNHRSTHAPAEDSGEKQVTAATTATSAAVTVRAPGVDAPSGSLQRELSETTTRDVSSSKDGTATGKTLTTPDPASMRALPAPAANDSCEPAPSTSKDATVRTDTPREGMDDTDIQHRVRGARQTLSSIHAELPEGLTPAETYAMTQMMLEAIKVNESCKTTSSMQRMEHIAEHGNEIQSDLRTIKEEKQRSQDIARRSLALRRAMVDGLFVGVVSMACTVAAVVWYAGSDTRLWPGLFGVVNLRTTRTLASATCSRRALSSTLPMGLGLPHVLPVLTPFVQLWCYAAHALRLVQAAVLLVLTPVLISKLGIFQLGDEVPVFKLMASCGLVCGASGWYAVGWLGGHAMLWLVLWEGLVALTIAMIVSAPRIASARARVGRTAVEGGWLLLGTIFFGFLLGFAPFVALNK